MTTALILERVDFIQLFLEQGASIEGHVGLQLLFGSVGQRNSSDMLHEVIKTSLNGNEKNACSLGKLTVTIKGFSE